MSKDCALTFLGCFCFFVFFFLVKYTNNQLIMGLVSSKCLAFPSACNTSMASSHFNSFKAIEQPSLLLSHRLMQQPTAYSTVFESGVIQTFTCKYNRTQFEIQ